jgi:hypothetical protein
MNEGFDILVNGVPRTFRDDKKIALDAARNLKMRNLGSEITVIDRNTGQWTVMADPFASDIAWQAAPGMSGGSYLSSDVR